MPTKNDVSSLKNDNLETRIPVLSSNKKIPNPNTKRIKVERLNKGFQIEKKRAAKWDMLVAKMKSAGTQKKTGPELMDEALDYLFEKYSIS